MKTVSTDFVETIDPNEELVIETIYNDDKTEFEGEPLDIERMVRISGEAHLTRGQVQKLIRTLDRVSKRLTIATN